MPATRAASRTRADSGPGGPGRTRGTSVPRGDAFPGPDRTTLVVCLPPSDAAAWSAAQAGSGAATLSGLRREAS
jgi:hypothetical protein